MKKSIEYLSNKKTAIINCSQWGGIRGSNSRPLVPQTSALPTAPIPPHVTYYIKKEHCCQCFFVLI